MIITVEISLYPLKDNFEETILDFIHQLRSNPKLSVYTNRMSTLIKGEMNEIFDTLKVELQKVYQEIDTASTVIKIVNQALSIEDGYYNFKD